VHIDILTVFPEMFQGPLDHSMVARARERGLATITVRDLRDYTHDRHRTTDDYPFGGGGGMVMKPEPVFEAIERLCAERPESSREVLLTCPQGEVFQQSLAWRLSRLEHLMIICGHYEGVDDRVRAGLGARPVSIGDYVLTGGELPTMVIIDAVVRLLPGVLGGERAAAEQDSFTADGLLEGPQYTRPRSYRGHDVPEVLLSGDHGRIAEWRRRMSVLRTARVRPDLLSEASLTPEEREWVRHLREEGARGDQEP